MYCFYFNYVNNYVNKILGTRFNSWCIHTYIIQVEASYVGFPWELSTPVCNMSHHEIIHPAITFHVKVQILDRRFSVVIGVGERHRRKSYCLN